MMMSNGGGGTGAGNGDGNINGRRRKRDHQEEEDKAAFMKDHPEGYKFEPKDEELIKYYLYPKIKKLPLPPNTIKDVNIYLYNPWDLTETYGSFYFFTPRKRKCPNGKILNRAANGGHWKISGNERPIIDNDTNKEIGYKKVLVFKPRKSSKMKEILSENQIGWHMYEYTLKKDNDEKNKSPWTPNAGSNNKQLDELVLCKILYLKPQRKSKKDRAVDVVAPPSNVTTTPSAAVAAAAEMPQNHHYVCQTDVAAADHRCPLTSRVLETAAPPAEMMPFNVNPSSSSVILPPVNHHYYGEMNQQRLQSTILPSVNQHYSNEMNQQQLQLAVLPSVNHQHDGEMINQQQVQSAVLPSTNQHYYDEINQQQLKPAVLPSINHHTYGQMTEQLLQPAVLPSVNHPTDGQMTQEQLQEKTDWEMLYAAWNNDADYFLKR